jgi:hypothetical protein
MAMRAPTRRASAVELESEREIHWDTNIIYSAPISTARR